MYYKKISKLKRNNPRLAWLLPSKKEFDQVKGSKLEKRIVEDVKTLTKTPFIGNTTRKTISEKEKLALGRAVNDLLKISKQYANQDFNTLKKRRSGQLNMVSAANTINEARRLKEDAKQRDWVASERRSYPRGVTYQQADKNQRKQLESVMGEVAFNNLMRNSGRRLRAVNGSIKRDIRKKLKVLEEDYTEATSANDVKAVEEDITRLQRRLDSELKPIDMTAELDDNATLQRLHKYEYYIKDGYVIVYDASESGSTPGANGALVGVYTSLELARLELGDNLVENTEYGGGDISWMY